MATKTFNDICVEYAHQLGKGLPLTPAEMCNAVIMYLNAQITEMQGITTALQTAVTEAEASATEAINKADNVSETVSALPKVPAPTASDNGKVIGVQGGAYALVKQSGGEAPANMVTTDTDQTITGNKTFGSGSVSCAWSTVKVFYECNLIRRIFRAGSDSPTEYTYNYPAKSGIFALTDDIPNIPEPTTSDNGKVIGVQGGVYALVEQSGGEAPANMVTTDTTQTISAGKTFTDGIRIRSNSGLTILASPYYSYYLERSIKAFNMNGGSVELKFFPTGNVAHIIEVPYNSGTMALTGDIPDLDNYTGTVHIVQGTAGSGIAIHDTANTSPYTKYGYDKIETYSNSNALQYTLNIPNKNGTIATLDDIGSPGAKKYLHNIIVMESEHVGIYFSVITERSSSYTSVNDVSNDIATMGVISATGWNADSGVYSPIISIQHDSGEFKYSYISDGIMSVYLPPLVEVTDNVIEL